MLTDRGTGVPGHRRTFAALRKWVAQALAVVRQVVGAPDYVRYVEHHERCHPGAAPLGPREYYAEFVSRRFGSGTSRCC